MEISVSCHSSSVGWKRPRGILPDIFRNFLQNIQKFSLAYSEIFPQIQKCCLAISPNFSLHITKFLPPHLLCDLVAALLEVHDGVGDLDVDGLHHCLDVEGADQPLTHRYQTVWKSFKILRHFKIKNIRIMIMNRKKLGKTDFNSCSNF